MDKYLEKNLILERAYVLLINGREHNVYITSIGSNYIFGFVAINKLFLLIDKKNTAYLDTAVVLPQDENSVVGKFDELLLAIPIVTVSPNLKIRVKIDKIDIIEDPWRPLVDHLMISPDGKIIDYTLLINAIPSLRQYYVKEHMGGRFVRNPDVWLQTEPAQLSIQTNIDVSQDKSVSSQ